MNAQSIHIGLAGENFDSGYRGIRKIREHAKYKASHVRHERMLTEVSNGMRFETAMHRLRETHSTSDFPLLMGDTLDRTLLGRYKAVPKIWPQLARRKNARDFRIAKDFFLDGANGELPLVKELAPYPETSLTEGKYEFQVYKRGKRLPLSMETLINDDLGAFTDIAQIFGEAAARTEDRIVTRLYAGNLTFFSNGNGNLINVANGAAINNPALTTNALADAFRVTAQAVDAQGEPIIIDGFTLVVGPALEGVANNIMNTQQYRTKELGGSTNTELEVGNWVKGRIKAVVVDHYIPIMDPTFAATGWYLFADPTAGRSAIRAGYLAGHEGPEILMKSPNAIMLGGGLVDALSGDFDNDSIDYKVRHFFGASLMDAKLAYFSKGTGNV